MSCIIEQRTPERYERFDIDLVVLHRLHNKSKALLTPPIKIETHPYVGKTFFYKGDTVTISSVMKDWRAGFYLLAFYGNGGSTGITVIDNINSISSDIHRLFEDFKTNFLPIFP